MMQTIKAYRSALFGVLTLLTAVVTVCSSTGTAWAQQGTPLSGTDLDVRELFQAGGVIGMIILALSIAMVALIVEHLLSIRRNALMPPGLPEQVHHLIRQGQYQQAAEACRENPSFLSQVVSAGLAEVGIGYSAVEKAMEDASAQHAARLFRKIEYLSVIGTIAPMLGLLGTVWGMMLAFLEFTQKANVQAAELAPGISKALVTTLLGLGVAVPAFASFAIFRNRIDELVAATSQMAEYVFADFKRGQAARRREARAKRAQSHRNQPATPSIPSVAIEREKTG